MPASLGALIWVPREHLGQLAQVILGRGIEAAGFSSPISRRTF
jgi:hypothetical protein